MAQITTAEDPLSYSPAPTISPTPSIVPEYWLDDSTVLKWLVLFFSFCVFYRQPVNLCMEMFPFLCWNNPLCDSAFHCVQKMLVRRDEPRICFQYCKYLEGGAASRCAPLLPLCPGLKPVFWLAEQSYLLGTIHAMSGMPGFQAGAPGNLTATEASVWVRLAHRHWRPHKDFVHQMKT